MRYSLVPCTRALALGCLFQAGLASAQVPAGGEFRVNTYTSGNQSSPSVSVHRNGDFAVAWQSRNEDATEYAILGQRYEAGGQPRGGEFRVNAGTTGRVTRPDIAQDARGNFAVVWMQDPIADIKGRRFGSDGVPRGGDFLVNGTSTAVQRLGKVAMDERGDFVVTWESDTEDGSLYGVFGRRYAASGAPGAQFQVNTYTPYSQAFSDLAMAPDGRFVVVWGSFQDGNDGIIAQRFDASGARVGGEFHVSAPAPDVAIGPVVAMARDGAFVVAWTRIIGSYTTTEVRARRFDASGTAQGAELVVDTTGTTARLPSVAMDGRGNFVVAMRDDVRDGSGYGIFARRFTAAGAPRGAEFQVNSYTTGDQVGAAVASDANGNFVVSWTSPGQDGSGYGTFAQRFGGLHPAAQRVDTTGNGVLEPGESIDVRPSWRNRNGSALGFGGSARAFTGPPAPGVAYTLDDATAAYGTVQDGATLECSDCYAVGVTFAATRPALHWDATLEELITPDALGQDQLWALHIGDSFTDVPRTSPFYRFVETLLHRSVTSGCGGTSYCPAAATTREQMAPFLLVAKEGAGYAPVPCGATPLFADVPVSSPFCPFVEELARRGVVVGCGGGNYCPAAPVTREQMSVFVLRTLDGTFTPPPCTTPPFDDVPPTSPFCPWIQELALRGIVNGCGGGNYCPAAAVTREQMSVFISATFGLTLYGP